MLKEVGISIYKFKNPEVYIFWQMAFITIVYWEVVIMKTKLLKDAAVNTTGITLISSWNDHLLHTWNKHVVLFIFTVTFPNKHILATGILLILTVSTLGIKLGVAQYTIFPHWDMIGNKIDFFLLGSQH